VRRTEREENAITASQPSNWRAKKGCICRTQGGSGYEAGVSHAFADTGRGGANGSNGGRGGRKRLGTRKMRNEVVLGLVAVLRAEITTAGGVKGEILANWEKLPSIWCSLVQKSTELRTSRKRLFHIPPSILGRTFTKEKKRQISPSFHVSQVFGLRKEKNFERGTSHNKKTNQGF